MRKATSTTLIAVALGTAFAAGSAKAEPSGYYAVAGVEADDLLKMRAGPGINYKIVLGLPNGAEVWVHSCERSGSTSWCKVSLKRSRGLKGFVSGAYLQKM